MEEIVLQAKKRSVVGKQVRALRREGLLPAVIYGRNIEPVPVTLNYREAVRVLPGITSSHLVNLDVEGEPYTVLVREKQHHPVTGALLHADFQGVSMSETLRVMVGIEFEGESPAVKLYNGVLVTGQEELEVECLPKDLIDRVVVDISILKEIGDAIHVRDIPMPGSIQVLTGADELVALITAPAVAEVEEEAKAPEVEAAEPEVIERGKKEEEEF